MTYQDVPSDVAAMAKLGAYGLSPQNCDHELVKLFGQDLKAPRPCKVRLPVLKNRRQMGIIT